MALERQNINIPFASGLNSGNDPRALAAPALAVCRNAQFDEIGGIQTRKPYQAQTNVVDGGGSTADVRRVVACGDELLLFTKDKLYSWSAANSHWALMGTHLAVKLEEQEAFPRVTEASQCDRAQVGNCIVYSWIDTFGANNYVFAAAVDAVTGAVMLAPTNVSAFTGSHTRVVALASKVLMFWIYNANVYVLSIDPTALAASVAIFPTLIVATSNNFDVDVLGTSAVLAVRRTANTYVVYTVDSTATVVLTSAKARTCDGRIALAVAPGSANVQIVRSNGVAIVGDYLLASNLSDVTINQALGNSDLNPPSQLTCAYRTVADGGQYRCYVFWSGTYTADSVTDWSTLANYVDTAGSIGVSYNMGHRIAPASRAFDCNGHVFLWMVFFQYSAPLSTLAGAATAALQTTYFLYRDDHFLAAKAASNVAGGMFTLGHLPNVQSLGSGVYAWCGLEQRVVPVNQVTSSYWVSTAAKGYSAKAMRDVIFTFDSNEARRTAMIGKTVYVSGGHILQYDGQGLAECGYHISPWYVATSGGAGGAKTDTTGIITYKVTWRWVNRRGEVDRSSTATFVKNGNFGSDKRMVFSIAPLNVTLKGTATFSIQNPSIEVWGTVSDPADGASFFLASSEDPAKTGDNAYMVSYDTDFQAFTDNLTNALLSANQVNDEVVGVLERLPPPAASIIVANQDRIFLAGIPGRPNTIAYSRLHAEGEVASFHDSLTFDVPIVGGNITALAFLDETLIVFRETAIFSVPGDGFDNASGGQNYGPARTIASDCGAVSQEAVALMPQGLIFKSSKGWHLLTRGGSVEYIGEPVSDFDSDTVVAVNVLEKQHHIRIVSAARILTYDYKVGQWSEWIGDFSTCQGATMWNGDYKLLADELVYSERTIYTAMKYGLDVETPWLRTDQMGFQSVQWIMVLGEYRSGHSLRIRIAYDYDESDASGPNWVDDKSWVVSPTTVGGPELVRYGPQRTKSMAMKIRITAYDVGSIVDPPTGEALKLTGLALRVGVKKGLYNRLPVAQKAGG